METLTKLKENEIHSIITEMEHIDITIHEHKKHHQLIYTLKGTLHIQFTEVEYFLPEGHICIIPSNVLHRLRSENILVKMFLLYFPAKDIEAQMRMLNTNDFVIENIRFIGKQNSNLNLKQNPIEFNYTIAFLKLLLAFKIKNPFTIKGLIVPKNDKLKPVLAFLKSNYMEEIMLKNTAEKFGFTVRNLSRLLKKENLSFNNFLNYLRIVRAIELLSENQGDIEFIAYEVGYKTLSNFSRTFKKYTGLAPSEFIKSNRTNGIIRAL